MEALSILHIEDDREAAQAVAEQLRAAGDSPQWAPAGQEGLRLAAAGTFDLIILDRMLPDLGGLEVVRRLRKAGVSVPVLMLSAMGRSSDRCEGLDAGVDDYMAKPYEPPELVARVRALHRRAAGAGHGAVILFGDLECHLKARTAYRQGRHLPLSPKAFT